MNNGIEAYLVEVEVEVNCGRGDTVIVRLLDTPLSLQLRRL
jgi:hypothetical protein